MPTAFIIAVPRWRLGFALAAALALAVVAIGPARLIAQIEGDRGIAPVASTADIEVDGIDVETTGKDGREARDAGWTMARRLAWKKYGGPDLGDDALAAMTSAIVIEREQIGPRRYIATLGVIFDRGKAGAFTAAASGQGPYIRSAPLLVVPILDSGGTRQVFEVRGPWQRAWANFQTGASPIDYVRPSGAGGESLLVNAGQAGRRSRGWWRTVLDQFGAADVLIPVARLDRAWPDGPVRGTFTARYGPDNTYLDSFTLDAADDRGIPHMLNQALVRIDLIYRDALARGMLSPDPTLTSEQRQLDSLIAQARARLPTQLSVGTVGIEAPVAGVPAPLTAAPASTASFAVQFASPDAAALDAAMQAVRGAAGVEGATVTSLAIGGTSVMRVSFAGDAEALAAALRARGWQVTPGGGGALVIRR